MILNIFLLAKGTRSFTIKNEPNEIIPITQNSGFIICISDMPADFIASNS